MDCYNYNCPFRYNQLPTSKTRCDCLACPNRSDYFGYIISSNRTLTKEEMEECNKKKMVDD